MSDDPILNKPALDMTSTDTDNDAAEENAGPKIFDITPDLNIAPAKDEVTEDTTKINAAQILESISKKPEVAPVPEEPKPTVLPAFGPANPPAKTVGFSRPLVTGEVEKKARTLQEAISENIDPLSQKRKMPEIHPDLKSIRTYEKDFAEAISKKHISTASFVIAEDKKKVADLATDSSIDERTGQPNTKISKNSSSKKWFLGIISLILICGALFSGYYLYSNSSLAPVKQPTDTTNNSPLIPNSIIKPDSKSIINIDNKRQSEIISATKDEISKDQTKNSIKEIVFIQQKGNDQVKVTANDILKTMNISAPDIFQRSLGSDWMLGVYTGELGQKNAFVITTNDFFQNAFAGIIQWEKTLPEDLKQFLYSPIVGQDGSSTSTTSYTLRGKFEDRLILNKDVREYVTDNGHIMFLYSFIGNDKLVITNNEEALQEIITRLENNTPVR